MTLREELKAQLAEEAAARNGASARKLSSRRGDLPVSANATADGGLITVNLPDTGALPPICCNPETLEPQNKILKSKIATAL